MRRRFVGKTALITGASRGQGAAEARLFAQEGGRVVIADVLVEQGETLAEEIRSSGGHAVFQRLDVADEASWQAVVGMLRSQPGGLRILVNNAGIPLRRNSMIDTTAEEWNRVLAVNLTGPFLGLRILAPMMRDSGGGSIINIGSIAGMTGHFAAAYSASKWGLRGLTKSAAMEFAEWNIRVNAVHPGIVKTPIVAGSDDFLEAMEWMTPLGHAAESEDIAHVVAFLASDDAAFCTGLDISADGGFIELGAYRRVLKRVQESSQNRL
jgi:3alpha(or 20beta)-hydroxysteroid dehydrogenase